MSRLLVGFVDAKGVIHKGILLAGEAVAEQFDMGVLRRLNHQTRRVRPEHQGNASRHTAPVAQEVPARKKVAMFSRSFYSLGGDRRFLLGLLNENKRATWRRIKTHPTKKI